MTNQHKLLEALDRCSAGDLAGAVALCQAILAEDPQNPETLHVLGLIANQRKNPELALKLIEAALAKKIDMATAWYNRALILHTLGRFDDALKSAMEAARLDPNSADVWNFMGIVFNRMGQPEHARDCHEKALKLQPDEARYASDYALTLYASHDLRGAYVLMRRALKLDNKTIPMTLANVLKSAGYPGRALSFFRAANAQLSNHAPSLINEAMAWLQIGDYHEGWKLWEMRQDFDARFHHLPFWQGARINHLLLYEDQGFGDALQGARYLLMLADHVKQITLQVAAPLQKLFAENFPMIDVITLDDPVPKADARARLMSLPFWFETCIDSIPTPIPYIWAEERQRLIWRERLASVPRPRIGIVWGGNPTNANDPLRSLPPAMVEPLLKEGRPHLVSLQKGPHKKGVNLDGLGIFDADFMLEDFSSTAALMAELDLVITTCTSTAHLAGAMGRPTWLMLCFDPYWVWLLGREDSPWYPTLRLFRQTEPGNWAPVIAHVIEELRGFISGDHSTLIPKRWNGPPLQTNPHAIELPEDTTAPAPTPSPPWHPKTFARRKTNLEIRQKITHAVRDYFVMESFVEVDTPILQTSPGNEVHLQTFATEIKSPHSDEPKRTLYLQTSPEFAMKKLLAAGVPRLYQMAHVFRNGERSSRHHPEFVMLEWYRGNADLKAIKQDCVHLLRSAATVAGRKGFAAQGLTCDPFDTWENLGVPEAFRRYTDIDILATIDDDWNPSATHLISEASRIGVRVAEGDGWDDLFFRILGERIEPFLGKDRPTFLCDYPIRQAALARPKNDNPRLAERFELYVCGIELANAFGELTDAEEQLRRFQADMNLKQKLYGERTPIDQDFIAALRHGLPECAGIALGFDRLVMLATGAEHIDDVLWLPVA